MDQDLKIIKKKYGENMAKLCRDFFPTLLEEDGLLSTLMLNNFEPSHILYNDLIQQEIEDEFKNYIYSLVDVENNNEIKTNKTPKELLSEAGYNLYECKTEEEVQSFRKYYAMGEELCTFRDRRLDSNRVFFAVKKDVDKIKRVDYKNPKRQDEYGTSVISIQFTKDPTHTLSIKNRYNHTVNNPDSTFSNNLDNIIEGLTESFEREYGLIQKHKNNYLEIDGYVKANDGKFYKYNYEIGNVYYCPNNIIIDDFEVKRYEKEKYIVMDYYVLDLVNKEISKYNYNDKKDAFLDTIGDIEKLVVEKMLEEKLITIKVKDKEDIKLVLNENNVMIKLSNPNIEKVGNYFLYHNKLLQEVNLPNLKEVGNAFLYYNNSMKKLTLPKLEEVKKTFLASNPHLEELNLPNLKEVGNFFLYWNITLKKLNLPSIQKIGSQFLKNNKYLQEVNLPNLQEVGDEFLCCNEYLKKLTLSKLKEIGEGFLCCNKVLQEVNLPNLEKAGDNFLTSAESLQELSLPNLQEVGDSFLYWNIILQKLDLPNLKKLGGSFLCYNQSLQELYLPNLEKLGSGAFYYNNSLKKISLPKLQEVGFDVLFYNKSLQELNCPNLEANKIGTDLLQSHPLFDQCKFKIK